MFCFLLYVETFLKISTVLGFNFCSSIQYSLTEFVFLFFSLQQFGKILDVEIIFNERGSKVYLSLFISVILFTVCFKHKEIKLVLYTV